MSADQQERERREQAAKYLDLCVERTATETSLHTTCLTLDRQTMRFLSAALRSTPAEPEPEV